MWARGNAVLPLPAPAPRRPAGRCVMGAVLTRERELRKAVKQARLPPRDFKIFTVLLDRADFQTAEIPGRFQPKSLEALAGLCEMSKATLCRGLAHLEEERWLVRDRLAGGRGCSTRYTLALGDRCYCSRPGRPRKRETVSSFPAETVSEIGPELSHQRDLNSLRNSDEPAGQSPVSAEGLRDVGGGKVRGSQPEPDADIWGPVCQVCGAPVSALRRAQTLARGVLCGRCETLPASRGRARQPGRRP